MTTPASAVCPQCGKTITLKKNGTFRVHRSGIKPWPGAPFTNVCTESGVKP